MKRKPYAVHSGYDIFYLGICRNLYAIIHELASEDEHAAAMDLDDEECRELAYTFTGYFEDQVNGIGFWRSLVALHKKHFGKRVPFFAAEILEQDEGDYDDILPGDIHYLAYSTYLSLVSDDEDKKLVFFNQPFFIELTERVFSFLDEIEEVHTNDFYEKYLVPAQDYIDFKKQLDWFSFYSYLTGLEFTIKLDNFEWGLISDKTDRNLMVQRMYVEKDRLIFEVPSSLTAFFPVDILAGAMRCNEEKKQEIINLKFRPHGIFHVQNETGTHYHFLHTATNEKFDVLISSFHTPLDTKMNEYWISTLANWNRNYYMSGMCMSGPSDEKEIYQTNLKMQQLFQKHFSPYRKSIEDIALNYKDKALKFFGNELIVFDTGGQLQEKLNEFNQWYFDKVTDKTKLDKNTKPNFFQLPKTFIEAKDVGLFIPPMAGLQFLLQHKELLQLLQTSNPDKINIKDLEQVLPMLFDDSIGADYWFYLKKNFSIPNLSLFLKCPVDADEDFEALLRIYRAADFSPLVLPRFSTFTSENILPETVTKIF